MIDPTTIFYKFDINSRRKFYWHLAEGETVRCNGVALKGRKNLQSKVFSEMEYWEKSKICRDCLGQKAYKGTIARREQYKSGIGMPVSPLCPYCNSPEQVACSEARGNRLSWWKEGRMWKCFGCGRRFHPDILHETNEDANA